MAKEIKKKIKLQIEAGKANPAPPVGPALGQAGVNIMEFCKQFNDRTKTLEGPIPADIIVYDDKSFTFTTRLSPASYMLMKEAKLKQGSKEPGKTTAGKITKAAIRKVAEKKMVDMNVNDIEAAILTISGTARSMGLEIVE